MKNSAFIKKNYKQSTIPRMKLLYGFKTLKDIDNSLVVTETLKKFDVFGNNPSCAQDILFDQIDFEIDLEEGRIASLSNEDFFEELLAI